MAIEKLEQTAGMTAQEIEGYVQVQIARVKEIELLYPRIFAEEEQDLLLERVLQRNDDFVDIAVLDTSGLETSRKNRFISVRPEELKDRSETEEYQKTREKKIYIGQMYLDKGRPLFTIGYSIYDGRNSFQGAVLVKVDGRFLQDAVRNTTIAREQGRAFIVNTKGIVIAHPDISQVLAQRDFSHLSSVSMVLAGEETPPRGVFYTNELGNEVAAAWTPIRVRLNGIKEPLQPGWYVIAEENAAHTLQYQQKMLRFILVALTVVVGLAGMGVIFVSRRVVAPIEKLHQAASQIGQGEFTRHLEIKTGDEIEDLSMAFNQMSQDLSDSINKITQDRNIISVERNKLEVVISGITDMVVAVDQENRIVTFNRIAEKLLGMQEEQVLGKPLNAVLTFYDKENEVDLRPYCHPKEKKYEGIVFEQSNLKMVADQKIKYVHLTISQIRQSAEVDLGCILTIHDSTAEMEFEEMKLDFVSIAAHELRTPLTAITGYLSFLTGEDLPISEEQKTFLKRTEIASQQLNTLVENLLNITKIEKGAMSLTCKPLDMLAVVKKVRDQMADRAEQKQISMTVTISAQALPMVSADEFRIEEVITNLLQNAINYTDTGGSIHISFTLEDARVVTHIADTGQGIPKDAIPKLFTKFFRVSGALEQGAKGTGLGLYITKAIVEKHGGTIWVDSEQGRGSTFSFSLPLV